MISVNQEALKIVQTILSNTERLGVSASKLNNGTTVIDMGQRVPGSWLAGKYFAEITMGGMGEVTFGTFDLDGHLLPSVIVNSSNPLIAGWVCQKHAEPIPGPEHQPILTGPAKALLYPPDFSISYVNYQDNSSYAVAPLQTSYPITEEIAWSFAKACQIHPENLFILVAPSNSLVCAIQVAARPLDNLMHRLQEEGFDIRKTRYAYASAPLPPLSSDELEAMGRINDSLLYGGHVVIYVEAKDEEIEQVLEKLPTIACPEYGKTFRQIFEEHDCDFHKIDLRVHSTARIQFNNITTGHSFITGKINYDILRKSFFGNP